MFGVSVKIEDTFKRVEVAAEKANFANLGHAAASLSKDAKSTIERVAGPSAPGKPPHTRRGQLKRAIRFDYDKESALIGPMFSMVGVSGEAHEFGKAFKGQQYPERPFMGPALQRAIPRFAAGWAGSISE